MEEQIQRAQNWYYSKEFNQLVIRFIIIGTEIVLPPMLKLCVRNSRRFHNELKEHPAVEIVVGLTTIEDIFLETIEELDKRSPRILLLLSLSDLTDFRLQHKDLERFVIGARARNIKTRLNFNISTSCDVINELQSFIQELIRQGGELAKCINLNSPVIDISPLVRIKDPKDFAQKVIDLWHSFPWLEESVSYAIHGPILESFQMKERIFLDTIAENGSTETDHPPEKQQSSTGSDTLSLDYASFLHEKLVLNASSSSTQFRKKRITLDNDWDFVFDSYECQSPIFFPNMETIDAK